ncbi:hypothetical protein [Lysinibacillus sp. YS11]|uniref:hypothetical protein n=1 Tax=Lysinibacillus sp. YS11 TaxID=2072025 RepID=UPI001F1CEAC7|nr:hypothetical protein [Lysinibacillus sp. YS11]
MKLLIKYYSNIERSESGKISTSLLENSIRWWSYKGVNRTATTFLENIHEILEILIVLYEAFEGERLAP